MALTRRAQHVADTRGALVAAARELFAERGYAGTGTEEIVARARVTRGALYHHFRDKKDLFRAVMDGVAREAAEALVTRELTHAQELPDEPWDQLRHGFQSFLDVCTTGDFQRIVLIDGPAVLGQDVWDQLVDEHGHGLLAEWLRKAMANGEIDELPVAPLARLLAALISEASLYTARAEDPDTARRDAGKVIDRVLAGLRRTNAPEHPDHESAVQV
ncbi:TetR/AcrR family transcriptional regulator [Yinghuangia sp. ASG 101]|uniref:TetR/AcrR family transcriptional regulator n=1 Tax=Yinghuangia sp. ASG 101 TaxID=2896848 RepID=UPI001E4AB758|nr:TetR/AcrR family transcriptional regulator [Yinghuangia sp. ASG 101]UGQ13110.1 TetR/AcrR family transcriptional regulator [Yinghuangia sp. ASG 101]